VTPTVRSARQRLAETTVEDTIVNEGRAGTERPVGQLAARSPLEVSVSTAIGKVRRNNEDYVRAERLKHDGRSYAVWVVADGVGGGPQGEEASRMASETLVDFLVDGQWSDPSMALSQAYALACKNVYAITGDGSAATTMVAALVRDDDGSVFIANAGDSRAYLWSGGQLRPVTQDHSAVAERVARGEISPAEARVARDRNVLTRSVGSEAEVAVDVFGPRQLRPGERLLLCSDGVHGMLEDTVIARIVADRSLAQAAGALVAAAVEAGGRDNATALVGGCAAQAAAAATPAATARRPIAAAGARRLRRRAVVAVLLAAGALALCGLVVFGALAHGGPASTASAQPVRPPSSMSATPFIPGSSAASSAATGSSGTATATATASAGHSGGRPQRPGQPTSPGQSPAPPTSSISPSRSPSPSPTATATATATPEPTPWATPTETPSPTPTETPTATPIPTPPV
jgi:serine/threonine protein phosphatase PrpC